MSIKKQDIIDYLSNCNGSELIEILTKSLSKRPESGIDPLESYVERKLTLAEASRILNENDKWSKWNLCLVSEANKEIYEESFLGEPFLQEGKCNICEVELVSHVKGALCPLCKNEVWLT